MLSKAAASPTKVGAIVTVILVVHAMKKSLQKTNSTNMYIKSQASILAAELLQIQLYYIIL